MLSYIYYLILLCIRHNSLTTVKFYLRNVFFRANNKLYGSSALCSQRIKRVRKLRIVKYPRKCGRAACKYFTVTMS